MLCWRTASPPQAVSLPHDRRAKKKGREIFLPALTSFICATADYGYDSTQPPAPLLKALLHKDCTGKVPVDNETFADAP
jgi:hypothetical protein